MRIYLGDGEYNEYDSQEQYLEALGIKPGSYQHQRLIAAGDQTLSQLPSNPNYAPSMGTVSRNLPDGEGQEVDPRYVTYGGKRFISSEGVDLNNPGIPRDAIVTLPDGKQYVDEGQFYAAHPELTGGSKFGNIVKSMPLALGAVVGAAGAGMGPLAGGSTLGAEAGALGGAATGTAPPAIAPAAIGSSTGAGTGGAGMYSLGGATPTGFTGGYSSLTGSLGGVGGASGAVGGAASGFGSGGMYGLGSGMGGAGVAGNLGAATMGGTAIGGGAGGGSGLWENIFKALAPSATGGPGGSVAGSGMGGLLEAYGQNQLAGNLQDNTSLAASMAAPPVGQAERLRNQGLIANLWGPNGAQYMAQDSGYQAGVNSVNARSAKLGQMFSGNNANALVDNAMAKRNDITNTLSPLAGYQFGPGASGQIQAQGGADAARAQQNVMAGVGYAARPIVNRASDYLANNIFV